MPQLLDTPAMVDTFQVTRRTLYGWRAKAFGPRSVRIGGKLYWNRDDVEQWLTANAEATGRGGL